MSAKFCPFCGAALSEGARFCPSCGKPVENSAQTQQNTPTQEQKPASAPSGAIDFQGLWEYISSGFNILLKGKYHPIIVLYPGIASALSVLESMKNLLAAAQTTGSLFPMLILIVGSLPAVAAFLFLQKKAAGVSGEALAPSVNLGVYSTGALFALTLLNPVPLFLLLAGTMAATFFVVKKKENV